MGTLIVFVVSPGPKLDRKSTRLNSSHSQISYAVFCLKKKKILLRPPQARPSPTPASRHACHLARVSDSALPLPTSPAASAFEQLSHPSYPLGPSCLCT